MAKIARKHQKQFADIGWTGNLGQFGSYAAGATVYSNDPDVLQALDAYGDGMASALVNSAPPAIQDLDGLFHLITKQLQYIFQAGIPEWLATDTYQIGSLVNDAVPLYPTDANYANSGNIYMSLTNDNINKPLNTSSEPYWRLIASNRVRTVSTEMNVVSFDDYIILSTFSGNPYFFLPDAAAGNKGRIISIKKMTAAAVGHVSVQHGGSGKLIDDKTSYDITALYGSASFISNGVDKWYRI